MFTPNQLQEMAMLKARGTSWLQIAGIFKVPRDMVEQIPWQYADAWEPMLVKAEGIVCREVLCELINTLRLDARDAQPNFRVTIANSLSRLIKQLRDFAPNAEKPQARPEKTSSPLPDLAPLPEAKADIPPTPAPKLNKTERQAGILQQIMNASSALVFMFALLAGLVGTFTTRTFAAQPEAPPTLVLDLHKKPKNHENTAKMHVSDATPNTERKETPRAMRSTKVNRVT